MNDNNNDDGCNRKYFKRPVSWLMGRELLAGLKWIAAYTFMGKKQDPKDWMNTATITPPRSNNNSTDPYWFDYIADTGDGMSAVYNIAYLCMSELWIDKNSSLGADSVALSADSTCVQHLPRGEFLFVGGDTAYHIADTASLKERFQTPFNCAALDIIRTSKSVDQRPIYGVPANHDYYDALHGFNRQFCKPINDDTHNPLLNDPKDPQLGLLGFERKQTASYVALQLPFDWWLWGLDSQEGKMDKRQQAFFVSIFDPELVRKGDLFDKKNQNNVLQTLGERVPSKLIVTTPEPSTVFGRWAEPDGAIAQTFARLGLEASFLKDKAGALPKNKCRLDISGDIHHYERYWGNSLNDSKPTNYASVVAGGGGAFLHPSHTDVDEVKKQAIYPSRKDSHRLITQSILNPISIWQGGYIWLAGAFIAFLNYFAVTVPQSTWSLFKLLPDNLRPTDSSQHFLSTIKVALDDAAITIGKSCCSNTYFLDLIYIILFSALLGYWFWKTPGHFKKIVSAKKTDHLTYNPDWIRTISLYILPILAGFLPLLFLNQWSRDELPNSFLAGALIDLFFVAAMVLFSLSRRYSNILIDYARFNREPPWASVPLWVFNVLGIIYAVFGFLRYGAYSASIMTFDLVMVIVWLFATVGLVALAAFAGAHLLPPSGKIKFAIIGVWHALLQVCVPVCLMLYSDWTTILVITSITLIVTYLAGQLFTKEFLIKDFSLSDQKKIGTLLFVAWGIVGVCVLWAAHLGDPIAVNCWRLLAAFVLGAIFSCIWFGWYLAVSLAFHGHNNEAGGGARSEQYRHMIRFKLTEDTLTGYVIGIDEPVTDLSGKEKAPPKFRLVDVFTVQASKS